MRILLALLAITGSSAALYWTDPPVLADSVKKHLSSRTLYRDRRLVPGASSIDKALPKGHTTVYLHFISRHGTRWPTRKRMDQFATLLHVFQAAADSGLTWTRDWETPFKNVGQMAGQLHPVGEREMRDLGARFREKFPELLSQYNPSQHRFITTHVSRASASASAFAQGLFPCESNVSQNSPLLEKQQCCLPSPVSLSMRPKHDDPLLRFFDLSPAFDDYLRQLKPRLSEWESQMWTPLASKIAQKLSLPDGVLGPHDVGSLWQMCQQEASLFNVYDQACSLFDREDVALMEYVEDAVAFAKKGHMCPVAYTMAAGLLSDVHDSLIVAGQGPKSRFHFAHAETLGPLAAALGLFGATQDITVNKTCTADWAKTSSSPEMRAWWASTVIPFSANLAILVHTAKSEGSSLFVRLLWNEQAISNPANPNDVDCELGLFTEYLRARIELLQNTSSTSEFSSSRSSQTV